MIDVVVPSNLSIIVLPRTLIRQVSARCASASRLNSAKLMNIYSLPALNPVSVHDTLVHHLSRYSPHIAQPRFETKPLLQYDGKLAPHRTGYFDRFSLICRDRRLLVLRHSWHVSSRGGPPLEANLAPTTHFGPAFPRLLPLRQNCWYSRGTTRH